MMKHLVQTERAIQKRAIAVLFDYKTLQPDDGLPNALEEYSYCYRGRGIADRWSTWGTGALVEG